MSKSRAPFFCIWLQLLPRWQKTIFLPPFFFGAFQFLPSFFFVLLQKMRKTCLITSLCSSDLPWDKNLRSHKMLQWILLNQKWGIPGSYESMSRLWTTPGLHHELLRVPVPHPTHQTLSPEPFCCFAPDRTLPAPLLAPATLDLASCHEQNPARDGPHSPAGGNLQLPFPQLQLWTWWDCTWEAAYSHSISKMAMNLNRHNSQRGKALTAPHSEL